MQYDLRSDYQREAFRYRVDNLLDMRCVVELTMHDPMDEMTLREISIEMGRNRAYIGG